MKNKIWATIGTGVVVTIATLGVAASPAGAIAEPAETNTAETGTSESDTARFIFGNIF